MDNLENLITVGFYREFAPLDEESARTLPSIFESIKKGDYANKSKILSYITNGGIAVVAGMGVEKDIFTGQVIREDSNIRTDNEFIWGETLAYYVENYNLKLPDEFVAKAMAS